jgi:hypothetical protein
MRLSRALLPIPVLLALAHASGAAAAAPLCDDRPGRTVAATQVVRVLRETPRGGDPVIRGCRHGARTSLRLGIDGDCFGPGRVDDILAAGRYVAISRARCTGRSVTTTVALYDVRGGRNLLGASAFTGPASLSPTAQVALSELALSPVGALAWVATAADEGEARSELHLRRPGSGAPELVDARELPDLTDLAVTAHKLFWLRAGAVRSIDL